MLLFVIIFSVRVETLTCNKLSHCLFDFDCPDFNTQYENEIYKHHTFKFKHLVDFGREPDLLTLLDLSLVRDQMDVSVSANTLSKQVYLEKSDERLELALPRPKAPDSLDKHLVRFVYKPHSQVLWGFHKFACESDYLDEVGLMPLYGRSHAA